ncbi:MAG TPA: hypothetical protein VKA70_16295 [Blastocatellia bacterium]|nr:hypothetical protein [Blastocatellia bacterium]
MEGLGLLLIPIWIGSLICFIIVLIKLFQNEGALKGILGLICSLYTFVWGWMNSTKLNLKTIMLIWTGLIILGLIVQFATGASMYGGMR